MIDEAFMARELAGYPNEIKNRFDQVKKELISGAKTGHPVEIVPPQIPQSVPKMAEMFAKYEDNFEVIQALLTLYQFIHTPKVIDGFGTDDTARQEWERRVETVYDQEQKGLGAFALETVNQNKYRHNCLNGVNYALQILTLAFPEGKYGEVGETLPEAVLDWKKYRTMDMVGRDKAVEGTTQVAYQALKRLQEETQTPTKWSRPKAT